MSAKHEVSANHGEPGKTWKRQLFVKLCVDGCRRLGGSDGESPKLRKGGNGLGPLFRVEVVLW